VAASGGASIGAETTQPPDGGSRYVCGDREGNYRAGRSTLFYFRNSDQVKLNVRGLPPIFAYCVVARKELTELRDLADQQDGLIKVFILSIALIL
jgi:hypothetical protein